MFDEIYNFLKSIEANKNEIMALQAQNPNWHYNQILSKFALRYPKRLEGNENRQLEKRRNFRKLCQSFRLDTNDRLTILNPLDRENETKTFYLIPYKHEKEILINDFHNKNNHSGKTATYQYLINSHWFWYGMTRDIQEVLNSCPYCINPNKYKKLKGKNKIIIEDGPHYRYVADLWNLPNDIAENSEYKYILDIVDHFSKWYYGYPLKSKTAEEVFKNLETFFENFGKPKILQVDNGREFKNQILINYCKENNVRLVHSSPYHPQTNGVVEVTHKEIQKYIYAEFIKNKNNFILGDALFNIIKIHNNKIHSTTKRIPKDIKDLEDQEEIEEIKKEIISTLMKKNKHMDIVDLKKYYVFDDKFIIIVKGRLERKKQNLKKAKKSNKVPISIINLGSDEDEYIIEIKKTIGKFEEGEIYSININLLEEVDKKLWNNLL